MFVSFIVGFLSMFFGFLFWKLNSKKYLFLSFLILFIYLAIRYDFGSDYMTYYSMFKIINDSSWREIHYLSNLENIGETTEFGFIYFNKILSTFSDFFFLIAVQSFVLCFVYFNLIKRFVINKFVWLAFFILIFNVNLLVRDISGLRQGFAIFYKQILSLI